MFLVDAECEDFLSNPMHSSKNSQLHKNAHVSYEREKKFHNFGIIISIIYVYIYIQA